MLHHLLETTDKSRVSVKLFDNLDLQMVEDQRGSPVWNNLYMKVLVIQDQEVQDSEQATVH